MKARIRFLIGPALAALFVGLSSLASAPSAALAPNGLLVQGRDALLICVQTISPGATPAATALAVRTTLDLVRREPIFAEAGLDVVPSRVDTDCSMTPALLATGLASDQNRGPYRVFSVAHPSTYRTGVFVVSDEDQWRMFGGGLPLHAQESLCLDSCYEVTTALYVTPGQLTDPDFTRLFRMAIGLARRAPQEEPPTTR